MKNIIKATNDDTNISKVSLDGFYKSELNGLRYQARTCNKSGRQFFQDMRWTKHERYTNEMIIK